MQMKNARYASMQWENKIEAYRVEQPTALETLITCSL